MSQKDRILYCSFFGVGCQYHCGYKCTFFYKPEYSVLRMPPKCGCPDLFAVPNGRDAVLHGVQSIMRELRDIKQSVAMLQKNKECYK